MSFSQALPAQIDPAQSKYDQMNGMNRQIGAMRVSRDNTLMAIADYDRKITLLVALVQELNDSEDPAERRKRSAYMRQANQLAKSKEAQVEELNLLDSRIAQYKEMLESLLDLEEKGETFDPAQLSA